MAEDAVQVSIAVLLSAGAAVLVVRAGISLVKGAQDGASNALLDTLDA